jgi:uncharacterized Zn-finger protein
VHTRTRVFACQSKGCMYRGSQASHLKEHAQTHTRNPPFPCQWKGCAHNAKSASILEVHAQGHIRKKHKSGHVRRPFACSWKGCTYRANQSSHLKKHVRTHPRQAAFACPRKGCTFQVAEQSFLIAHNAEMHGATTSLKKAKFSTTTAAPLASQTNDAADDKPLVCEAVGCEFRTARLSKFERHKRVHNR